MLRNLARIVCLLSIVAAFVLPAGASFGQEDAQVCPGLPGADSDGDGFFDDIECQPTGLPMKAGLEVEVLDSDGIVVLSGNLPSCFGVANPDRRFCMSPAQEDLFVIAVPANPSQLPEGPFETLAQPVSEGGLGIHVHLLTETGSPGDRVVSDTSPQKALRITEDLDPNGDKLGQANYGTPNNIDRATIWTVRIANFIAATCSSDALCVTDTGAQGFVEVAEALSRWVIEHEGGHLFKLSRDYNKRFGGFHLKAGTDSIMAQFVAFNTHKKTGLTTFFIPTTFDAQSQADVQLTIP